MEIEECSSCEEKAVYECLGCSNELCEDCHVKGLCVECQGYSLRWPINMDDVRVFGGEPKPLNPSAQN